MTSPANQRSRTLYIMKILLEETDAENPLSMKEILSELERYGMSAERKAIYGDLDLLRRYGLDVRSKRGHGVGYYIASRAFSLPELKLLVDAVQSSRFLTARKSDELIKKLASLTSVHQAKQLRRAVYVAERPKTINETVCQNIDSIHFAINNNKKITHKYFDYDVRKQMIYRRSGAEYESNPIALCWASDNYYMIAYGAKYDGLTHYRVDRMSEVAALDKPQDKFDRKRFNAAEHAKRFFGMYGGEIVRAEMVFDNSLVNVVLDHFGKNIRISARPDGKFEVTADVSLSPVFLAWLFQFGDKAEIKAPEKLIDDMTEGAAKILKKYSR
jgi:predicted DNA-binding transcriptional regulator YafY